VVVYCVNHLFYVEFGVLKNKYDAYGIIPLVYDQGFLTEQSINQAVYKITTRSKKAEKQFYYYLKLRHDMPSKIEKLKEAPRKELDAHKLKGQLEGKWSCSLGYDIRMVYEIDDENKEIIILAVGSHKLYY